MSTVSLPLLTMTDTDEELARLAMPPPSARAPAPPLPVPHSRPQADDTDAKLSEQQQQEQQHKPPSALLLRVRIATVEWALVRPLPGIDVGASPLDGARLARVPVLRVWGPTPGGQRACVHIHKVKITRARARRKTRKKPIGLMLIDDERTNKKNSTPFPF